MARASSLSPDDLEYVLNAFPLFSHKHPDFFACLRQCLEELSQPEGVDGLPVRTNGWYNAPADSDVIGELLVFGCTCLEFWVQLLQAAIIVRGPQVAPGSGPEWWQGPLWRLS